MSVVFPCYNDEHTIGALVDDVYETLSGMVECVEVIVVDDGSPDGAGALLDRMATDRPWLRVIHHLRNRGYGQALISGFEAAQHSWIFYTDGDAQYDVREVASLLPLATDSVDVVQGYKLGRGDAWHRKVIGRAYHHVVRLMFGLRVRDTDCDFRLFRRELFSDHPLRSSSGVICVEMMRSFQDSGARFVETPVHHYFRPSGRSQFFRLPAIARSAVQLLQLWWTVVVRSPRGVVAAPDVAVGTVSLPTTSSGSTQRDTPPAAARALIATPAGPQGPGPGGAVDWSGDRRIDR